MDKKLHHDGTTAIATADAVATIISTKAALAIAIATIAAYQKQHFVTFINLTYPCLTICHGQKGLLHLELVTRLGDCYSVTSVGVLIAAVAASFVMDVLRFYFHWVARVALYL